MGTNHATAFRGIFRFSTICSPQDFRNLTNRHRPSFPINRRSFQERNTENNRQTTTDKENTQYSVCRKLLNDQHFRGILDPKSNLVPTSGKVPEGQRRSSKWITDIKSLNFGRVVRIISNRIRIN